jgi:imidazolonepropionase-like amidohydrolase
MLTGLVLSLWLLVPQDTTYAFVDITLIPMDRERVVDHQTVLVRNGRIAELGAAATVQVPAGAVPIDGRGKFLMPGLAETHAHIPAPQQGYSEWAEDVLFLYLSGGVTTIRGMLGHPSHLDLRRRVAAGEVLGPRIWTSGPSANGTSTPSPTAADSAARATKAAGYDFIKIHPGLSRASFDALDAAADEGGITFSGHVPTDVGIARALEARYASIDHLDGYLNAALADGASTQGVDAAWFAANWAPFVDPAKLDRLARQTQEAGVWNVPTQSLMESYATDESAESMAGRPELRYIPPPMRQQWVTWKRNAFQSTPSPETRRRFLEVRRRLIKALHEAGAGLLLGSDAPQVWNVPGFSIRRELESIVAAGLTPYEALLTGTRNVAVFFGVENEAGTIAVGKRADLVLLDANPLADVGNVANPAGVMVHGRWLPRSEIQARLDRIAQRHAP